MSGWEIMLFSLFLPMCFWQTTGCSENWHPCTNRLSVQSCWVRCISVLQRLGVPSCSFVFALHLISYLRLHRSQVSLFDEHLPTLTHISHWSYRLSLPSRSQGKEKAWKAFVRVWWQSTEGEMGLLRPQMQMEVEFSFMLEGSFSPESNWCHPLSATKSHPYFIPSWWDYRVGPMPRGHWHWDFPSPNV